MVTNIWSRHKEFAVLHSIGMTHRQIRRMLRMEGMYYCLLTAGLMLTAGSGILWLVKVYMGFKVEYFAFTYPWMLSAVMILALAGICAGIPVLAYRNNEKHITFLRGK